MSLIERMNHTSNFALFVAFPSWFDNITAHLHDHFYVLPSAPGLPPGYSLVLPKSGATLFFLIFTFVRTPH